MRSWESRQWRAVTIISMGTICGHSPKEGKKVLSSPQEGTQSWAAWTTVTLDMAIKCSLASVARFLLPESGII